MKRYRIKSVITLLIAIYMVGLIGCQKPISEDNSDLDRASLKVGVLLYRFDDQFIQSLIEEMEKEVLLLEETNDVIVTFDFVDGKNQQDIQYDQLRQFIEDDYDALAINLVDRSVAAKVIEEAKEANIPIVFFNRQPVQEDMARWNRIYYVGTEGEEAGLLQGDIIADYWNKHPEADKNEDGVIQYVMLQGQVGHQDAILRSKYSVSALKDKGFMTQELANDTANWQRNEAKDKMSNWIDTFGDEMELVISNNDAMALGAVDAMKEKDMTLIPVIGVDAIHQAIEALDQGEMIGTVLNDNVLQGQYVIQIANYLAKDEDPSKKIDAMKVGKYLWVPYQRISN